MGQEPLPIRTVAQLLAVDGPARDEVRSWVEQCPVPVQVLPRDPRRAEETLHRLQVTVRSTLGSMAYDCGGLLVDHGWLRLLGGGYGDLPTLAEANGMGAPSHGRGAPASVLLGWDLVGGCFAIDGGAYGAPFGHVCYFAPDLLEWEDLGMGHSAFVEWVLSGEVRHFSLDLRWPGWEEAAQRTGLGEVVSVTPAPWETTGRRAQVTRQAVPVGQQLALQAEVLLAEDPTQKPPALGAWTGPGGVARAAAEASPAPLDAHGAER